MEEEIYLLDLDLARNRNL